METELVELFESCKPTLTKVLAKGHPESYINLVKLLFRVLGESSGNELLTNSIDIHQEIKVHDNGDGYSGSYLFVIYDTWEGFYVTAVDYGSCSCCDAIEAIREADEYDAEGNHTRTLSETQVKDYLALCLHLVQEARHFC